MDNIATELVGYMVGSIGTVGNAVGSGISNLVKAMFIQTTTTGGTTTESLSIFAVCVAIFAGVSLAFGLTRWALNFVSSLGARNR